MEALEKSKKANIMSFLQCTRNHVDFFIRNHIPLKESYNNTYTDIFKCFHIFPNVSFDY